MNFLSNKKTLVAIGLGFFAVFSQWSVWELGVFALGANSFLIGTGFWLVLLKLRNHKITETDLLWFVPLWLMLLSLVLYENPWLKTITLLILPILTGFILAFRQSKACDGLFWSRSLLFCWWKKTHQPLRFLDQARKEIVTPITVSSQVADRQVYRRIFRGLVVLIPLASIVLILLSSADSNFMQFVDDVLLSIWQLINLTILLKLVCALLASIVVLATFYAWTEDTRIEELSSAERVKDDIVVGIVVAGILIIYLVFLYFQAEYLWLKNLPIDFAQTEKIVKSGFWQLFGLSILNTVVFVVVYKNTNQLTQIILRVFILASGLIMLSGCWRMGLYVYWYGLSHEKFFASYTAIYALFMFGFLSFAGFCIDRKDIFKFIALSSLWFYATATITPIEKIIFKTNISLSSRTDTRVNLYHLSVLSIDVKQQVEQSIASGALDRHDWSFWLSHVEYRECSSRWYALNLSRVINCAAD